MEKKILTMKVLQETYGVCRLDVGEAIPAWALKGGFFAVTRTEDELSIVCEEGNIPEGLICEKSWKVLKVEGPLDFALVGILASISRVLADKGVSIFAVSTYDTDYILLKENDLTCAVDSLRKANYEIVE